MPYLSTSLPRISHAEPGLPAERILPAEPAVVNRSVLPVLAQAAAGPLACFVLAIGAVALMLAPNYLAAIRIAQGDAQGGLARLWVVARLYTASFAAGAIIGCVLAGTFSSIFFGSWIVYGAVCGSFVREIANGFQRGWMPLPDDGPIIARPRIDREPAPPFPAALPVSQAQGWRRNNQIMRGDGGAVIAAGNLSRHRVQQACGTLRLNLIRCLGGPQAEHFLDFQEAQSWLDRQPHGPLTSLKRACGVLDHIGDQSNEILRPLVEAAELMEGATQAARQEHRHLNSDERERIMPGLVTLREGFQGCAGAWTAHLPMVVNLLRNDQIEPRNWILRLFAQERLEIVSQYFEGEPQQVHHINQLRYELWTYCRIALPGAASSQRDSLLRNLDALQSRQDLAWTIHTVQNPAGLASTLREAINKPAAAVILQQLQAEISRTRMESVQVQRELRVTLNRCLEQAQRTPSAIDPLARQRELEAELSAARAQLAMTLPWGALAEDLLRASPNQRAAAREALLACPSTPIMLQEHLRQSSLVTEGRVAEGGEAQGGEAEGGEESKTHVERALARTEMAQPDFRRARNAWRGCVLELTQLRSQIEALEPLRAVFESQMAGSSAGSQESAARWQSCFQRVQALSDLLAEARFPSMWQLMADHPQEMQSALLAWMTPGFMNFERLGELLTTRLLATHVQISLTDWFANDLLTEAGAFEVLGHYNYLMRTGEPA